MKMVKLKIHGVETGPFKIECGLVFLYPTESSMFARSIKTETLQALGFEVIPVEELLPQMTKSDLKKKIVHAWANCMKENGYAFPSTIETRPVTLKQLLMELELDDAQ
jgi:hypothetical protein